MFHVTVPPLWPPLFFKAIYTKIMSNNNDDLQFRDKSLCNHTSKYRVEKLIALGIKKNDSTTRVGYIPVHTRLFMTTVDDTENLNRNLEFLQTLLSQDLLISLSIFGSWGSYVHLRYTVDTTRPFLIRITPSRTVFIAILVPRDP